MEFVLLSLQLGLLHFLVQIIIFPFKADVLTQDDDVTHPSICPDDLIQSAGKQVAFLSLKVVPRRFGEVTSFRMLGLFLEGVVELVDHWADNTLIHHRCHPVEFLHAAAF